MLLVIFRSCSLKKKKEEKQSISSECMIRNIAYIQICLVLLLLKVATEILKIAREKDAI